MLACSLPPCAPRWRPEIPSMKWLGPDGAAQNGAESGGNAKLIFRDCPFKKHARARGGEFEPATSRAAARLDHGSGDQTAFPETE